MSTRSLALALLVALVVVPPSASAWVGGSPDVTFSATGRVIGSGLATDTMMNGMLVDDAGLTVFGDLTHGETTTPAAWRITSAGVFMDGWAASGRLETPFPGAYSMDAASRLADGSTVFASSGKGSAQEPLVRLRKVTPSGALDPAFGSGGDVAFQDGIYNPTVWGMVERSDGSIVYAGSQQYGVFGGNVRSLLGRVTPAGVEVEDFPSHAALNEVDGGEESSYYGFSDVALLAGDAMLLSGYRKANERYLGTVKRIDAAGNLDTSFGTGGTVSIPPTRSYFTLTDIAFDPSRHASTGRVIVAGIDAPDNNSVGTLRVLRLEANGAVDPTFGGPLGFRLPLYQPGSETHLVEHPDGRVHALVVGNPRPRLIERDLLVVALTPGGLLDRSFDVGGMTRLDANSRGHNYYRDFADIGRRANGDLWVLGMRTGLPTLWRLHGTRTTPAFNVTPKVTAALMAGKRKLTCGRTVRTACRVRGGQRLRFAVEVSGPRRAGQRIGGQMMLGTMDPFPTAASDIVLDRDVRFTLPGVARVHRTMLSTVVSRVDASANTIWAVNVLTHAAGNYRGSSSARIYLAFVL